MNLELTDEQKLLREAARDAFSRFETVAAARAALTDASTLPDLWPTACAAGWPGLLVGEWAGGAGLGAFDALLVMMEAGRVLAGVGLLGHLPASALLDVGGSSLAGPIGDGAMRACLVGARPPGDGVGGWTVESSSGFARRELPLLDGDGLLHGRACWVVDAPGADVLVVMAGLSGAAGADSAGAAGAARAAGAVGAAGAAGAAGAVVSGAVVAVVVEGGSEGVAVEPVMRYDATRSLGHVTFAGARGVVVDGVGCDALEGAWYLSQALLAAESLGGVDAALGASVAYAKERFTFGRAIGSYQAVKHSLVEVLRLRENAYSLLLYAGWAYVDSRSEFALAASAARVAAGEALDYASRVMISVHGGSGATWEHDAPLFFRRAQLSRRLLGGLGDATDRVAGELLGSA